MSDPVECHGCTRATPAGLFCPCPGSVCITCCQREHGDDDG